MGGNPEGIKEWFNLISLDSRASNGQVCRAIKWHERKKDVHNTE